MLDRMSSIRYWRSKSIFVFRKKYDYGFMDYTVRVLIKCKQYGFRVYIDPHQDTVRYHVLFFLSISNSLSGLAFRGAQVHRSGHSPLVGLIRLTSRPLKPPYSTLNGLSRTTLTPRLSQR